MRRDKVITQWTLIRRALRFHARANVGVTLGAAVGSAALIGALAVGDSVRESLRERALNRVANAYFALAPQERTISAESHPAIALSRVDPLHPTQIRILRPFSLPMGQPVEHLPVWSGKALVLAGTASLPAGTARANQVHVYGVDQDFWEFIGGAGFAPCPTNALFLNAALAARLGAHAGDEIILRVNRPSAFSREAAVSPRGNQVAALRLKVAGILPGDHGGDLELKAGASAPLNAFVPMADLAGAVEMRGRANVWLTGPVGKFEAAMQPGTIERFLLDVKRFWYRLLFRKPYVAVNKLASAAEAELFLKEQVRSLEDLDLKLEYVTNQPGLEVRSPRVFLDPAVVGTVDQIEGTNCTGILTYLANLIEDGTNTTPYSMVTAAGPPYTPLGMADDEIVFNQWLADDLQARPGDRVVLSYFDPDSGSRLEQRTNVFRLRAIVPMELPWADRSLMPDFPGIEKAANARDWDAGFPLVYKIPSKDEDYWKTFRGTPKAFVTLASGQKMWRNRFGELTAIRIRDSGGESTAEHWGRLKGQLTAKLNPEDFGLKFEPVREQAVKAAEQSQDFGQLFLGFSAFLVVSALLLMALLYQFAQEQRVTEVGTLLAVGFTGRQVRLILLFEGASLAFAGGVLGVIGGIVYAKAMLWGLTTIWRNAIGSSALAFHVSPQSLAIGLCAGTAVAAGTIWLSMRRQGRQPVWELLSGIAQSGAKRTRMRWSWVAVGAAIISLGIIGWSVNAGKTSDAEAFFSAGSLLLVSGLAAAGVWLNFLGRSISVDRLTTGVLGVRNCGRRRKRSLASIALLASGSFIVLSIGVFRLDAQRDATRRESGTGGFALFGESTLPVVQDLNSAAGREAFGLDAGERKGVQVVAMRVHEGDEASCLNLNRAQQPRLVGVNSDLMTNRFTFTKVAAGLEPRRGWSVLQRDSKEPADEVRAIGDANSIQWALGKKVGDTIDYVDDHGKPFKVRLVGAVANSILQGSLMIDETEFIKRFPGESGYRMFLMDAPTNRLAEVAARLSRGLQDLGLEVTPTVQRLDGFNAVQNTYLGTFQVLGGLGLLLGSAGLGIIVLRNVWERRGELGLLMAVGFRRGLLHWLVLSEHGALLGFGLLLGIICAGVAVLPAMLTPGMQLPYGSLALTLGAVLINGLVWTWVATKIALRGNLLEALRNE